MAHPDNYVVVQLRLAMVRILVRVGLVLIAISGEAMLAGWLGGPAALGTVIVIAGVVLGMRYVPSWGSKPPTK